MRFIEFILVGLIAGCLAGKVMRGGGYGVLVDIILGILGGILGGWLFGMTGWQSGGLMASLIVALIGAIILVWITGYCNRCCTVLRPHASLFAPPQYPSQYPISALMGAVPLFSC
jgi:uncharacterized membrane protein YeaQ/YmgE (transglycosylase-associated protein family)